MDSYFLSDKRGNEFSEFYLWGTAREMFFLFGWIFLLYLLGPQSNREIFFTCRIHMVELWEFPLGSTAFTTGPRCSHLEKQLLRIIQFSSGVRNWVSRRLSVSRASSQVVWELELAHSLWCPPSCSSIYTCVDTQVDPIKQYLLRAYHMPALSKQFLCNSSIITIILWGAIIIPFYKTEN